MQTGSDEPTSYFVIETEKPSYSVVTSCQEETLVIQGIAQGVVKETSASE